MTNQDKVDIVITWVDVNDKLWQDSYHDTFPQKNIDFNRYTEMGLLKYWFRSIEKNAPWVNKIHFVTQGHLPDFLNINHPKLNIVKHEDYIPEKYLPTFSSHPIELNFHRIEDLAEKFIYFNDDMYLINRVEKKYFFKDGLPKTSPILRPLVSPNYYHISEVQQNNYGIVNQNFDFKHSFKRDKMKWINIHNGIFNISNILFSLFNNLIGLNEDHMPNPFLKSVFEEVWKKEYKILDITSSNKLRNIKVDVNQWLIKIWQILSGKFYPTSMKDRKLFIIESPKDVKKIKNIFNDKKINMICINDHVEKKDDYTAISNQLIEIFENEYSEKSSFEI